MAITKIFKKTKSVGKKEILNKKKDLSVSPNIAWKILEKPHISEKATFLSAENKYIFKVNLNSNKIEIKKAIEELFGVNVVSVNIVNIPKKKKRLGKYNGWKKEVKKAIVEIKKGQQIDVMPT